MTINADNGTATTIIGGAGNDTLIGGDQADTLTAAVGTTRCAAARATTC